MLSDLKQILNEFKFAGRYLQWKKNSFDIFLERRFSKRHPNTKRTLQEDKTVTSFFHQAENQETSKWSLKNLILIFFS